MLHIEVLYHQSTLPKQPNGSWEVSVRQDTMVNNDGEFVREFKSRLERICAAVTIKVLETYALLALLSPEATPDGLKLLEQIHSRIRRNGDTFTARGEFEGHLSHPSQAQMLFQILDLWGRNLLNTPIVGTLA